MRLSVYYYNFAESEMHSWKMPCTSLKIDWVLLASTLFFCYNKIGLSFPKMTIRSYLWGMRLCTLAALSALGLVVFFVNPAADGLLGQVIFFASLFFFITGIATLFLFWLRRNFSRSGELEISIGISFRQGVLIALAVCALFLLQGFRLLVWWDGGIVVVGVLLIELWFLSR